MGGSSETFNLPRNARNGVFTRRRFLPQRGANLIALHGQVYLTFFLFFFFAGDCDVAHVVSKRDDVCRKTPSCEYAIRHAVFSTLEIPSKRVSLPGIGNTSSRQTVFQRGFLLREGVFSRTAFPVSCTEGNRKRGAGQLPAWSSGRNGTP